MFVLFSVEKEMKLRSHAVQRNLPRPLDVNENILRNGGPDDPPLSELQKVRVRVVLVELLLGNFMSTTGVNENILR